MKYFFYGMFGSIALFMSAAIMCTDTKAATVYLDDVTPTTVPEDYDVQIVPKQILVCEKKPEPKINHKIKIPTLHKPIPTPSECQCKTVSINSSGQIILKDSCSGTVTIVAEVGCGSD